MSYRIDWEVEFDDGPIDPMPEFLPGLDWRTLKPIPNPDFPEFPGQVRPSSPAEWRAVSPFGCYDPATCTTCQTQHWAHQPCPWCAGRSDRTAL